MANLSKHIRNKNCLLCANSASAMRIAFPTLARTARRHFLNRCGIFLQKKRCNNFSYFKKNCCPEKYAYEKNARFENKRRRFFQF